MTFVSGDIAMEVEMPGGFGGGLKRKLLAGESLFVTHYKANGAGSVGLTGPFPGSIRQHELEGEIICEKHAYLGHVGDVRLLGLGLARRIVVGDPVRLARLGAVRRHGLGDLGLDGRAHRLAERDPFCAARRVCPEPAGGAERGQKRESG